MQVQVFGSVAFAAAVALGASGIAAVAGAEDGAAPAPSVSGAPAGPVTSSTTSTTSAVTTTSTTVPPVATPEPPPDNPQEAVPVVAIGRIRIPAIGLDHEIYEGVSLTVIDAGPGHWPGTPTPGGDGNVVFGGHRVTHSHPFRDVDQLRPGDEISFEMYDGTDANYRVTEHFVVDPDAMWIVDPMPGRMLTLFACHPKGSARQRIVVRAEFASV